ncbi:MAG: hypothetical protein JO111_09890 [Caulobacteraceae bacterium]|nr:hypothetical protein [Caulobacteraceae bacterium]
MPLEDVWPEDAFVFSHAARRVVSACSNVQYENFLALLTETFTDMLEINDGRVPYTLSIQSLVALASFVVGGAGTYVHVQSRGVEIGLERRVWGFLIATTKFSEDAVKH